MSDAVESDIKHERLDVDALVVEPANIDVQRVSGFVDVPENKKAPHPARYFEQLFLAEATRIQDVIKNLEITEEYFYDFLSGKVSVDIRLAKKLANFTGMLYEFWLRIQNKFDDSNNVHSIK